MVYRGRPSAACFSCRARRIKCDRKKPACTQCARIRIDCPGYCDPLEQNFRDESKSVVKRAEKSYKNANHASVWMPQCAPKSDNDNHRADSQNVGTFQVYQERDMSSPCMLFSLSQSIEDVAVVHFMSSYIPGSHFDYLPRIYGQPSAGTVLPATVHAASVASLARELGQANIMDMARRLYAKALVQTNAALANPATAANDATLISVLLLSLFEAIVWACPRTPSSWTTHTRGAFALVKLRGSQQLETAVGRGLFVQVANIICVNSIQQKARLPPELLALVHMAMEYERESPRYRLACLTGHVSNLMADINEGGMKADEIVEALSRLDAQYVSFVENFPPAFKYQEVTLEKSQPEVYGKTIHQYPSHRTAQLWNTYRMTRILLNSALHDYAFCLTSAHGTTIQMKAIENLQQMAIDICASIPPFINPSEFATCLGPQIPYSPSCEVVSQQELISPKATAASLLWPLSAIRGAGLINRPIRAYAVERLKYLGREFRVPQAEKVATEDCEFGALQDGLHMFYVS